MIGAILYSMILIVFAVLALITYGLCIAASDAEDKEYELFKEYSLKKSKPKK